MTTRRHQAAVWSIWGLLAAYGALQAAAWLLRGHPPAPLVALEMSAGWIVMILLGVLATSGMRRLSATLTDAEHAHRATISEVEQLEMQNATLQIIARSVDVPLAFQALAQRIARLVPCERVGLALLSESGTEFQTYTARLQEGERRSRPRPEVVFKTDRSAIGTVVRSCRAMIINDTAERAADYLDVNVLRAAGFGSALVVPLISTDRAVGTLNAVSRKTGTFQQQHIDALQPIAEIFAVTYVAQQLQIALAKHKTMESMSELTIGISNEINGALQSIIGHCDLLERGYPDTNLQMDLAVVVRQAQRISSLLDKMRAAAHDRLKQTASLIPNP
jgi:GAF domain-containing protein